MGVSYEFYVGVGGYKFNYRACCCCEEGDGKLECAGALFRFKELIGALRILYFPPGGSIVVLEVICAGRDPSREMIESVLLEFNDMGQEVSRNLRKLRLASEHSELISLRKQRMLREISYAKGDVRVGLKFALHDMLMSGERISVVEAKIFRDRIVALNILIEDAEEALIALD